MADLDALIARLEAATEGSGDLDRQIADALGLYQESVPGLPPYVRMPPPQLTASLDCALTLVPEGWTRRIEWLWGGKHPGRYWAAVRLTPDRAGASFEAEAQTEPLAVCIAALRARS